MTPGLRRVLLVAWREFTATVFTWAFLLSAVLVPVAGAVLVVAVPALGVLSGAFDGDELTGELWVFDAPHLADALERERLDDDDLHNLAVVAHEGAADAALEGLTDRDEGDPLGVVVLDGADATLYVSVSLRARDRRQLADLVASGDARRRGVEAGLDVDEVRGVLRKRRPETITLGEAVGGRGRHEQAARDAINLMVPLMGLTLVWLGVFVSAQYLLQNTIEERSSKVMEVLLSAVSPLELMSGKILGLGAVGVAMASLYGGSMVAGLVTFALADLLDPGDLVLFCAYYVMAYLAMGSLFAAIGSAVNELREAQSLMTPAILVMSLPFMVLPLLFDEPDGRLAVALGFVPPATPFVMIFRVLNPDSTVPWWQILGTLVVGFAFAFFMVWASARVFRIGVLMQGKAPLVWELMRWVAER